MMEIRAPKTEDEWKDYFNLRYQVLRAPLNQPLGSERNDGDSAGIHFALYEDDQLMAIARLDQAEPKIAQVRFVAVANEAQGKGFGRAIMLATEEAAQKRGDTKMILQARDYAVDFYLKLNYTLIEKSHLLFGILQHYKMEKEL